MTNTTNESEAMEVWRKARRAFNIVPNPYPNAGTEAAARVIATALEARDAELAELRREMSRLSGRQEVALIDQNRARVGIEYKSRAELLTHEVYVDDEGTAWTRPTAWAYRQVCLVKAERDARIAELEGALEQIAAFDNDCFTGNEKFETVGEIARAILTKGNTHD